MRRTVRAGAVAEDQFAQAFEKDVEMHTEAAGVTLFAIGANQRERNTVGAGDWMHRPYRPIETPRASVKMIASVIRATEAESLADGAPVASIERTRPAVPLVKQYRASISPLITCKS